MSNELGGARFAAGMSLDAGGAALNDGLGTLDAAIVALGGGPITVPTALTDFKDSVRFATTENIDLTTGGLLVVDGGQTVVDDRVLVRLQDVGSENGLYLAKEGAWVRTDDADADDEVTSGMLVAVDEGTVSANLLYILTTADPVTVGTTALSFATTTVPASFMLLKRVSVTSYTLARGDTGRWLRMHNSSANTATIPPHADVNIPIGSEIIVQQWGLGATTIVAGSGVTLRAPYGLALPTPFSVARLKKIFPDTWTVLIDDGTSGGGGTKATAAEVRSAASGDLYVAPEVIESASAFVALTDGANISLDWDAGINRSVTLGGNRTLDNPTNGQPGTWRTVIVTQDGTGSRTLEFGSNYDFPGKTAPTLTTDAAAVDVLSILCVTASLFYVFTAQDMG